MRLTLRLLARSLQAAGLLLMFGVPAGLAQDQAAQLAEFQSSGKTIHLERFSAPDPGRHPAILLTYGASGLTSHGDTLREDARDLANHGFVVFLIHYFDATDSATAGKLPVDRDRLERWTKALRDGITYARKDAQIDHQRVGLLGFSLGAYLALWESSQDSRVKAVVEYYGSSRLFMAPPERMPPTLILHGEKDSVVPVAEAYKLERLLEQQHAPYEIKIYPNQEHGFDWADGDAAAARDAWQRTLAFFHQYL